MERLYVASLMASRDTKSALGVRTETRVAATVAESEEHAYRDLHRDALRFWPAEDGWEHHLCSVAEVPTPLIERAYKSYHGGE